MALPIRAYRADIVLRVALNPAQPDQFTPFCGATAVTFNITNEITSEKVADCDDLTAAVQTIKGYGAQDVSITLNGTWARQNHTAAMTWALDQLKLPFRLEFVDAPTGDIEFVDGIAMLGEFSIDNIANIDGNAVTRNITLQVDGGIETTLAT